MGGMKPDILTHIFEQEILITCIETLLNKPWEYLGIIDMKIQIIVYINMHDYDRKCPGPPLLTTVLPSLISPP